MVSRPPVSAALRANRVTRAALLLLALVMALAQVVAVRHAYSHTPTESSSPSGSKHPGGLAHCDACIAAVALGGAAPPPAPLVFAAAGQQLPQPVAIADHPVPPQPRPYSIRAPPVLAS